MGLSPAKKVEPIRPPRLLEQLEAKCRTTSNPAELEFIAVNESAGLCHYRQAAFWHRKGGIRRLSGVVQVEANAPYVHWLGRLCTYLSERYETPTVLQPQDLPDTLANDWDSWLPRYVLWVPLTGSPIDRRAGFGGLLFADASGFAPHDIALLDRWCASWYYTWVACRQATARNWLTPFSKRDTGDRIDGFALMRKSWLYPAVLAAALLLLIPVNLTVLAPAELIPKDPIVVRSPMDGVIDKVFAPPNTRVETGATLFALDTDKLRSQFDIARRKLAGLNTQYHQVMQRSLVDDEQKSRLAVMANEIAQKEAEVRYLQGQLRRAEIKAQQAGMVLYGTADELEGKPVQTGEAVMRLVDPEKVLVEAWLSVGDAVPIRQHAELMLYLSSTPTRPVKSRVVLVGYEPLQQPTGDFAYRVRAEIEGHSAHRVGLKGVAKIVADEVPLYYWMFRRPVAAVRQFIGI